VNVFPSRILVVDDDPGLRRTLERILREDYPVETVGGATEAKLRLDQETFSLAWWTCACATETATRSAGTSAAAIRRRT